MTGNEELIRAVYRMAEGDVQDLEGWRSSFTEDGVGARPICAPKPMAAGLAKAGPC
jgi:hypothetical protein